MNTHTATVALASYPRLNLCGWLSSWGLGAGEGGGGMQLLGLYSDYGGAVFDQNDRCAAIQALPCRARTCDAPVRPSWSRTW